MLLGVATGRGNHRLLVQIVLIAKGTERAHEDWRGAAVAVSGRTAHDKVLLLLAGIRAATKDAQRANNQLRLLWSR